MKYQPAILIATLSLVVACGYPDTQHSKAKTHKHVPADSKTKVVRVPVPQQTALSSSQTFTVDAAAAVITILDTAEIDKRHKATTDDDFYTGADDFMFYISQARTFLEKQPIKIIELDPSYKYLEFKQANGVKQTIKLDTVALLSNLYFFDPHKAPHNADVLDVEGEYKKYFKR